MRSADTVYHSDCIHFRGDLPCAPHKRAGYHCATCPEYRVQEGRILIIKLGATGDVIRTTPLIHKLRDTYPDHAIHWLTYSPEVVPAMVHKTFAFGAEALLEIEETPYDILINLDKDPHACALANRVHAARKMGFVLRNGKPAPADERADAKFLTGLFDDVNKANTLSYPQEIFAMCGWEFAGEEYILDVPGGEQFSALRSSSGHVVGLNTGCGERWTSRRWKEEYWIELVHRLTQAGHTPLLLGGKQEHEFNTKLAASSGAMYYGFFPMRDFISLVDCCHTVVTTVTLALHIAIGLRKRVVLMNNIFNPHEFELYGRGRIVAPAKECHCFFRGTCSNTEYACMDSLTPDMILTAVEDTF